MTPKRWLKAALLVSTAILGCGSVFIKDAEAQTVTGTNATRLLLPFSTLNSTTEGKAVLAANLQTVITINNTSTAAQRTQAIADNPVVFGGGPLSIGLGSKLNAAYNAAVTAADPAMAASGSFMTVIRTNSQTLALSDSVVAKNFYANGNFGANTTSPFTAFLPLAANQQLNLYNLYITATSPARPGGPLGNNPLGSPRPFQVSSQIDTFAGASIVGPASSNITSAAFPSGHATISAAEALVMAIMVPERYQELMSRAAEEGFSRLVLGVHYPLDTIGGRMVALYDVTQYLNSNPVYNATGGAQFAAATTSFRNVLAARCGATVEVCAATSAPDAYSNYAATRAEYLYRLNYGLPSVGPTNLAPVVPEGAEVLLSTRFPYLSAAQRRDVLATTELPSGQALDDGSGWARLNLFDAAAGYGAFTSATTVTMNAASGGYNASDTWRNDIGGTGSLTKAGTGTLAFTGRNTWTGATTINGGTLAFVNGGATPAGSAVTNASTLSFVDGAPTARQTIASYSGAPGSIIALDANLGGAAPNADRLTITGAVAAGTATTIVLNNLTPNSVGVYDPNGVVLVSASAIPAGSFALSGGPITKGLYEYDVRQTAAGTFALASAPSAVATQLSSLGTSPGEIWQAAADTWRKRIVHERGVDESAFWIDGFGQEFDHDDAGGHVLRNSGVIAGFDIARNNTRFSVTGSYVQADDKFDGGTGKVNYDGAGIGASLGFGAEAGPFLQGRVKADFINAEIIAPALTGAGATTGEADVKTYGAELEAGYRGGIGDGGYVEPFASVLYLASDGSADIGGSSLSIESEGALFGEVGLRLGSIPMNVGGGALRAQANLSVRRAFTDDRGVQFQSTAGGSAMLIGVQDEETAGLADISLAYQAGPWSAQIGAGIVASKDVRSPLVNIGLRRSF